MNVFLDTESNGTVPAEICQLAALVEHEGTLRGYNWFFPVTVMNDYALKKHRLSRKRLLALSGGLGFEERAAEILALFPDGTLVIGHNVGGDLQLLDTELRRVGQRLPGVRTLDTMRHFSAAVGARTSLGKPKNPTLGELFSFYVADDAEADHVCAEVFCGCYVAHDARYDAVMTYLAVRQAHGRGDIRGVL